jgi:hypothetical protein
MPYLILIGTSWKNSSSPQYVPRLGRKISHSSGWLSHPKFCQLRSENLSFWYRKNLSEIFEPLEFRMVKKSPQFVSYTLANPTKELGEGIPAKSR